MLRIGLFAGVAAAGVALCQPAAALEQRVSERVFLVPDKPGTPTQFRLIVLAGCSDEDDGRCRGLAHYLEHLVLVGRNPEHKDIAMRLLPDGSSNGHTSGNATVYVHTIPPRDAGPKADLERLFAFYAARLRDFSISEAEALRERNVVLQEHDWRVASSPFRRLERKLDGELLPGHPAGLWTIGTRESIESLTLAEARSFHQRWYAINNVYFLVKADIEAKDLGEIAGRALAGLESKQLPARPALRRPEIVLERKDLRDTDAQVKRATVTYKKVVRMAERDGPALRAARALLSSYLNSRLPGSPYERLVDTAKVAAGGPSVSIARLAPGAIVLRISAATAHDSTPQALLDAISAYVDAMAGNGPSPEQIERLKKRSADARVHDEQDPAVAYNRLVGWLAARNAYEEYARWPSRIAAVTPADVQQVLGMLAGPGRVVTGTLLPATEEAAR